MQSMMEEELRKSEILQMSWILHILIITELYSVILNIIFKKMSPGIQVCESQSKYRVSIAQWVERWHGTPEALGSSPG